MHPTRNDMAENRRHEICGLIQTRLAESIDLYLQVKQAHWNVRGANFIALHELFDQFASEIEGSVDSLAERIVALGGTAEGTLQAISPRTQLAAYPLKASSSQDHLNALAQAFAAYGKKIREAVDQAAELKDAGTADLFTAMSQEADKRLWFVEAHLGSK